MRVLTLGFECLGVDFKCHGVFSKCLDNSFPDDREYFPRQSIHTPALVFQIGGGRKIRPFGSGGAASISVSLIAKGDEGVLFQNGGTCSQLSSTDSPHSSPDNLLTFYFPDVLSIQIASRGIISRYSHSPTQFNFTRFDMLKDSPHFIAVASFPNNLFQINFFSRLHFSRFFTQPKVPKGFR